MGVEIGGPVRRGDVYLVRLEPRRGREIRKSRPCVVVSPDDLNVACVTYIVAPLTTGAHPYPYRIPCRFAGREGHVLLDQVLAVDHGRLAKRLGQLPGSALSKSLSVLREMFAV